MLTNAGKALFMALTYEDEFRDTDTGRKVHAVADVDFTVRELREGIVAIEQEARQPLLAALDAIAVAARTWRAYGVVHGASYWDDALREIEKLAATGSPESLPRLAADGTVVSWPGDLDVPAATGSAEA